jgi:hypothetical protein
MSRDSHPVERLILALGSTSDEVAHSLQEAGVRGKQCSSVACPLAVYLRQHGHEVEVAPFQLQLNREGRWNLPWHIVDFVDAFDHGLYPALLEQTGGAA